MDNKVSQLEKAMEVKKREDGTGFTTFSDTAPESLRDLFLEYYEVRNLDYEIFSDAIDAYVDASNDHEDRDTLLDYISDNHHEHASIYHAERLAYLDIHNQDEIADIVKDHGTDISDACAYWYDNQVNDAVHIIHEWVTTN